MSDPRTDANGGSYNPDNFRTYTYDNSSITYDITVEGGSSKVGLAVTLNSSGLLETAADGEMVLGKLIQVEPDGECLVQIGGHMTLPGGNGASLTPGKEIVGALNASSAEGYIREVATGTAAELGRSRGFIEDATTTTAVVVCL